MDFCGMQLFLPGVGVLLITTLSKHWPCFGTWGWCDHTFGMFLGQFHCIFFIILLCRLFVFKMFVGVSIVTFWCARLAAVLGSGYGDYATFHPILILKILYFRSGSHIMAEGETFSTPQWRINTQQKKFAGILATPFHPPWSWLPFSSGQVASLCFGQVGRSHFFHVIHQ